MTKPEPSPLCEMTPRAPRPEGMSDQRLAAIAKRVKQASDGPWIVVEDDEDVRVIIDDMVFGEAVIAQIEQDAEDGPFIAHARQDIPDLLAEVSRLRADGATLRERVRKLPSPLSWHAADSDGEGCEAHIYCAWCGHTTPADSLRRDSLHHGTCLWGELASAPKEPTP